MVSQEYTNYSMLACITEESKLIPIISEKAIAKLTSNPNNFNFTTEFDCGYGVADVVFYSLDKKLIEERARSNFPELTKGQLHTILAIQDERSASITFLSERLSLSRSYIKYTILKDLIDRGIVLENSSEYTLSTSYKIGLKESVAIEAKLSDWKRGLYQAYRYKWFAETSYLAIYSQYAKRAIKYIEQFEELNVGLLSIDESGVTVIHKPKHEAPYSHTMRALTYEKMYSCYFKDQYHPSSLENLL